MYFSDFSAYLSKLEATTKRLEITTILAQLINELEDDELDLGIFLSLGYLKAPFENPKFNVADKMIQKVLERAFVCKPEEIKVLYERAGDLGDVTQQLANNQKKAHLTKLTITDVYNTLLKCALTQGSGSQEEKIAILASLLNKLDAISAKFVTRIVLGTLRLGFTELTILDALAEYLQSSKDIKEAIEKKYNGHPDIGLIAKIVKTKGIKGLEKISIETGVPVLVQKCQRVASLEEIKERMPTIWAEFKFDGTRVQLHLDRTKKPGSAPQTDLFGESTPKAFVKTFTRNQEETTYQYPDIITAAINQIDAKSVILDGEAIGYDKETGEFLVFQQIMQRKRKHGIAEAVKDIPLKYFIFDILYYNGNSTLETPLLERRELLDRIIKKGTVLEVDSHVIITTAEELEEFFNIALEKSLEGIIAKRPDAPYQAGAREYSWIKFKRSETSLLKDTVDCVILGYSYGKGTRSSLGIGKFLAGVYDLQSKTFKTITKVGTGLKEEDFIYLKNEAEQYKLKQKPTNIEINKVYEPDVWLLPKIVVELGGDEISKSETHSSGYALRFPRLIKFRPDKNQNNATTCDEIERLYKLQKRGYY